MSAELKLFGFDYCVVGRSKTGLVRGEGWEMVGMMVDLPRV